uniref:Uncharacterized protein n=1 Tax=Strigamia maritima TaxID=126957 RepID=T1IUV0_STRMM
MMNDERILELLAEEDLQQTKSNRKTSNNSHENNQQQTKLNRKTTNNNSHDNNKQQTKSNWKTTNNSHDMFLDDSEEEYMRNERRTDEEVNTYYDKTQTKTQRISKNDLPLTSFVSGISKKIAQNKQATSSPCSSSPENSQSTLELSRQTSNNSTRLIITSENENAILETLNHVLLQVQENNTNVENLSKLVNERIKPAAVVVQEESDEDVIPNKIRNAVHQAYYQSEKKWVFGSGHQFKSKENQVVCKFINDHEQLRLILSICEPRSIEQGMKME